jgi:hypothetical protein
MMRAEEAAESRKSARCRSQTLNSSNDHFMTLVQSVGVSQDRGEESTPVSPVSHSKAINRGCLEQYNDGRVEQKMVVVRGREGG